MVGASYRFVFWPRRLRRWTVGLCAAGLPLLAAGCAQRTGAVTPRGAMPQAGAFASERTTPVVPVDNGARLASYEEPKFPEIPADAYVRTAQIAASAYTREPGRDFPPGGGEESTDRSGARKSMKAT